MKYVLKRTDGQYVTQPGAAHSYTTKLEHARIYPTREAADRDRCEGNESVVSRDALFDRSTEP